MPVSVLLVDDIPELRAVLRQRLWLRGGFEVVADVGDGASAVTAAALHQPDVIVLDLGLPDLAGHEVLTRLRAVAGRSQVLVYTGSVSRDRFALAPDVDAYLSKDRDVSDVVELLVDLTGRGRRAATIELGPEPTDVRLARQFLAAHCQRWRCGDLVDDAQLVVSELVTNAIVHAGLRCELGIVFREGWLRIEVRDGGAGGPEVQAATDHSEHGRGLLLVSAMTMAWGVEPLGAGGKVVWAELVSSADSDTGSPDPTTDTTRRPGGGPPPRPPGRPGVGPDDSFRVDARPRRSAQVARARRPAQPLLSRN